MLIMALLYDAVLVSASQGSESALLLLLLFSCSVVSDSLRPHGLNSPWHSPDQNTGVSSLSLLQGIFLT